MKVVLFFYLTLIFQCLLFSMDIYPKVTQADSETVFVFHFTPDELSFQSSWIEYMSEDGFHLDAQKRGFQRIGNKLDSTIKLKLKGELFHTFRLMILDQKAKPKQIGMVQVFSLEPDLFKRRPYKGEFHSHSNRSDGRHPPHLVGAFGRRAGLDFYALTDHNVYESSLIMCDSTLALKCDFLPIRGEEYHSDNFMVHALAIGAIGSVTNWKKKNKAEFQRAVQQRAILLDSSRFDHLTREITATHLVLNQKARDLGAKLLVMNHPWWFRKTYYNAPLGYRNAMLETFDYDVVETPNDNDPRSYMLGVNKIRELERKSGRHIKVIGVSDAHTLEEDSYGESLTLVFSNELKLDDIVQSVKDGYLVSRCKHSGAQENVLYLGDERLARYAYFLEDHYFPTHRQICKKQGEKMLKILKTQEKDARELEKLNQELRAYNARFWAH